MLAYIKMLSFDILTFSLSLSLALRSISQWPLISLRPMVRIVFSVLIGFVLYAVLTNRSESDLALIYELSLFKL